MHGYAQRLAIANGYVCPQFARRFQQGEVGCHAVHHEKCLLLVAIVGKAVVVFNDAVLVGLLNNHASHTALLQFFLHGGARCGAVFGRNHLYLHTLEVCIGAYYGQNLIVYGF